MLLNMANSNYSKNVFYLTFAIFLIILFSSTVFALTNSGNVKIFAVTESEVGMAADLYLYTIPGTGDVAFITSNSLVGKDTQTTGNIALQIASKKTGVKTSAYNFIFDIRANASEVDGPSAGAAMTLLAYSLLSEKALSNEIGLTGTINNDGSIGVVGGVYPKAKTASEIGIKLLMIPRGEANQVIKEDGKVKSINLLSYAPEKLGLKVVEVTTIDDVIKYAYSDISQIKVDTNITQFSFVPEATTYPKSLEAMKEISKEYIRRAKNSIDNAKKELETTTLEDAVRSAFYPQLGVAERNIEMSKIFLDQNYLYSAANYSFNARVLAGTIEEIAKSPTLLNKDSKIIESKIYSLRQEINLVKQQTDFIPLGRVEWIIGAQQRLAYSENALNKIISSRDNIDWSEVNDADIQAMLFDQVYDYVSAKAWMEVAGDFLKEGKKAKTKKQSTYTTEFTLMVKNKLDNIQQKLEDSNAPIDVLDEALRRYNSAKISFDNNFIFAALYDSYFAESFIDAEIERKNLTENELEERIDLIHQRSDSIDSIWANMFLNHSKFFLENSKFEESINRPSGKTATLKTAHDLAYLSTNLETAFATVDSYIMSTNMPEYVFNEPIVKITYNQIGSISVYLYALAFLLILLLVVLIFAGLHSTRQQRIPAFERNSRVEKVNSLLNRLDKALTKRKISDAEYFFMKKKYEDEYKSLSDIKSARSRINLTLEESRAKLRALENGLSDLERHYKSGLIIPEDYERQSLEVKNEIGEIRLAIRAYQQELRFSREQQAKIESSKPRKSLFDIIFNREPIKGTEELAVVEQKQEKKEKAKRRKIIGKKGKWSA